MDSIIALFQGMGIMHMEWGQAVMIIVSLVLLWLAIARGFEPLLLLPIGFGGLLSNIPEAGMAMTALDNLLHHGTPEQLAIIAAKQPKHRRSQLKRSDCFSVAICAKRTRSHRRRYGLYRRRVGVIL